MIWPTFSCQILIIFSFLESLWHKETNCTTFDIFLNYLYTTRQKICTFLTFSNYKLDYLKFCKFFLHIFNSMVMGFSKMYNHFLDILFLQAFLLYNWILQTKKISLKIFLQILKVDHKSFPMMYHLSYLDIKHVMQGGGSVSWFSSTPAGIGLSSLCWFCNVDQKSV